MFEITPRSHQKGLTAVLQGIPYVLEDFTRQSCGRRLHESGSSYMKSLVYETPASSFEDLIARISVAAGRIRDMSGIFDSKRRYCQAC
ncbi:hypothetical protein TNCV_5012861 [Trichonephila clavipes]|nr:hypothetical protein TNCV_5012861 [Trichonephila clavipes]